jgi:hypothetical protein
MAIGSGLAGQFGIAAETTRNTYVAPTIFYPGTFKINKRFGRMDLDGSAAGRHTAPMEVATNIWGEGEYEGIVLNASFGRLFQNMFGTTVTPVQQGGTTAYLQTHAWTDNFGKYFSAQEGRPNRLGTVNPVTGTGGKLKSLEFSCEFNGLVKVKAEMLFGNYTEAQVLASATYVATRSPFTGAQMDIKLGTFGSTASVTGVRGYSIKYERPMSEDFYGGANGLMAEPVYNDVASVTGSLDVDLVTKADFMDRSTSNSATSLTIEHIGAIIATIYPYTLRHRLPSVTFGDDDFGVSDNGVVKQGLSFRAFDVPSTGLAFLDYLSTDTSI